MKIIDLFCGAGGFSEGFKQAGHEIILAIDLWEDALKTHELNHPETEHWLKDITTIKELPEHDVVIGGPPCQSFSLMGKRKGIKDPRGSLVKDFVRLTKESKFVLFENVKGIQSFNIFQWVLQQLKLDKKVLNCADYGVPTTRERVFASNFGFPRATHSKYPFMKLFPNDVTAKYITAQDSLQPDDNNFFFFRYSFPNQENHKKVIPINQPFPTILGSNHFYVCRRFTTEEFRLIMGFPSEFQFEGSDNSIFQQIANSVPPPVGKAFGELLNEAAEDG